MTEQDYEKLLNINTIGEQKKFYESLHYNRYEPTSYHALNTLCENYTFQKNDSLIDFGCGKGRLNFYIHSLFNCNVTGIEMNNYYIKQCFQNLKSYNKTHKKSDNIFFENCLAQNYDIKQCDNKFYFFNPFSIEIFINVLSKIQDSKDKYDRIVDIILYYPSDEYLYYLENHTSFRLIDEIKVLPNYEKDFRQKFLIYRL